MSIVGERSALLVAASMHSSSSARLLTGTSLRPWNEMPAPPPRCADAPPPPLVAPQHYRCSAMQQVRAFLLEKLHSGDPECVRLAGVGGAASNALKERIDRERHQPRLLVRAYHCERLARSGRAVSHQCRVEAIENSEYTIAVRIEDVR